MTEAGCIQKAYMRAFHFLKKITELITFIWENLPENRAKNNNANITERTTHLTLQYKSTKTMKAISPNNRKKLSMSNKNNYNIEIVPLEPLEMMEKMIRTNPDLIKMATTRGRDYKHLKYHYCTIIQIVNINSFVGNGVTEYESRKLASINAVDYFANFARKVFL